MSEAFTMIPSRRAFLELTCAASLPALIGCGAKVQNVQSAGRHVDDTFWKTTTITESEKALATVQPSGFIGRAGGGAPRKNEPGRGPQPDAGRKAPANGKGPTGLGGGTPTNQGRNMYVLWCGYNVSPRKPEFLEALKKSADFMMNSYRDKEYGGLFASVAADGKMIDGRKESYGTAAAINGIACAAQAIGTDVYREGALQIWRDMKKGLRDERGLFKRETSRDFKTVAPGKNTQNPMMHLFEGLLSLYDATQSKEVYQDAQDLADAVLGQLFNEQGNFIPEIYDADWKPWPAGPPGQTEPDGSPLDVYNSYAPAAQTGHVEVGHQVEWAYFLSRAVERGFPQKYLAPAERLLSYAVKVGFDTQTGNIFGYADYDGKTTAPSANRGWQIAEFVKMCMHWAAIRNRQDLWPVFDKSFAAIKNNPPLPSGYHGVGMWMEGVRLAELKKV